MTELTLQNHRRTMWHFIPGLALSAVITGVAPGVGHAVIIAVRR